MSGGDRDSSVVCECGHRLGFSARTIADLDISDHSRQEHIAEAIRYRSLDRKPS
ncbi:magnesium chelatase subunit ChlI family protein [Pelobacter propionicus]|uniref:magnesium chelatase subunit ChlI family protein n=1 Tax=Pelobacter propionicus TaxID=29543 RepID=UPI0009FEA23F|nr:hypothetical protein [Pelobacter propionicus]